MCTLQGFDVRSAGGGSESRAEMMARRIQMLKEHLEQSAQVRPNPSSMVLDRQSVVRFNTLMWHLVGPYTVAKQGAGRLGRTAEGTEGVL